MFETQPIEKREPVGMTEERIKKLDKKLKERGTDWTRGIMFVSIFGIVAVIFLYQMIAEVKPLLAVVMMMFGMVAFMPVGLILGWLFLDPYMRCKIKRRMRGKNYAVVNLVHKGGKRIEVRIKDLDDDVIVQGTKLWVIEEGSIYYIDKDNQKIHHKTIDPLAMVTRPNNIPELFIDAETMKPLAFQKIQSASTPQQTGAILLGYTNNQIAKNLFFKKQMTLFWVINMGISLMVLMMLIIMYDELIGF